MAAFEKTLITTMMVLMMASLMIQFAAASAPVPSIPPEPQYVCPICGEKFWTEEELYNHFIAEHPTTPIDIIWE